MNDFQKIWWDQVQSDYRAFELLQKHGAGECHLLHYLQMVTEKLAKAYYWRSGQEPKLSHKGFVRFFQTLMNRKRDDQLRIAKILGFASVAGFDAFVFGAGPIVYAIEALAPALSNGPNPEYPWPPSQPVFAPATYSFPEARMLETSNGRQLVKVIARAVQVFPEIT